MALNAKVKALLIVAALFIAGIIGYGLAPRSQVNVQISTYTQTHTEVVEKSTTIMEVDAYASTTSETVIASESMLFKVVEVIDGDSIVLEDGSEIRLLGINAPEREYPFYDEAKTRLSSLVLGKVVRLESDFEDKDRYGRLLRYIFINDVLVNIQLVKEGLANVFMESGLRYENQLNDAEYYARLHGLGIWEKNVAYAEYIYLVELHYDAAGNDNENLNDEYVVLGNKGDIPVDMTGWTIKDEANHIFTFPIFVLEPDRTVTIYTGPGKDTESDLYWDSKGAVWNNDGDTLYLRTADGELIFSYGY